MTQTLPDAIRRALRGVAVLALLAAPAAGATSLRDLGFADGIALDGPQASAELFFPMPSGATAARLVLDLASSPALDRYSSLTVSAGGMPVATIPAAGARRAVAVALPPGLARGGYLAVRLTADQALRRGVACFDNNVASVWTRLAPDSHLDIAAPPERGVGRFWAGLAGNVAIGLPAAPTPVDLETATILATALTARGAAPVMAPAEAAAVVVGPATTAGTAVRATLRVAGTTPRLLVADPAAERALLGAARLFANAREVEARATVLAPDVRASGSISLAEMGVHPATLRVAGVTTLRFALPFARLPAGTHPAALVLFGGGSAVPRGQILVATASIGGQLAWSRAFRGTVRLDGVRIPIPQAALRNNMPVSLRLVRGGVGGHCRALDTLSFQLRDTSRVVLAAGYAAPHDLAGFAMPFGGPALVHIDPAAMKVAAAAVPLLARLLVDAGANPAAVRIVRGRVALDTPFLDLAPTADTAFAASAPVRPDRSRLVLARPADAVRVVLDHASELSVVQTVTTGQGVPGLWISPGSPASLAAPEPLAAGNVAVLGAANAPVVFQTQSPEVVVEARHPQPLRDMLARWRIAIFVALWVLATLLIVTVAVRLRRPAGKT